MNHSTDMKKECQLKLITIQKYEAHDNTEETIIDAVVARRNGSSYITFKQFIPDYNVTINNIVKVKNGVVTVKRSGGLSSNMEFNISKEHFTDYETPYGTLDIRVKTKSVESVILQECVKLEISYEIYMQGKKISDNIYCIISQK